MRYLTAIIALLCAGALTAQHDLEIRTTPGNPGNTDAAIGQSDVTMLEFEFHDPANQSPPPQGRMFRLLLTFHSVTYPNGANPALHISNNPLSAHIEEATLWGVTSSGAAKLKTVVRNSNDMLWHGVDFYWGLPGTGPIVEPGATFRVTFTFRQMSWTGQIGQQFQLNLDPSLQIDIRSMTYPPSGTTPSPGGPNIAGGTISVDDAPVITNTTAPPTTEGVAYSEQLQALGSGALTWSAVTSLPTPNWNLSPDGLLTAPAGDVLQGTYQFDAMVEDTQGRSDTRTMTLNVAPPIQILTANPLPDGNEGLPYNVTLVSTHGTGHHTWSAPGLPAGWSMSSGGEITAGASDTISGNYNFDVTVTDNVGAETTESFDVFIDNVPIADFSNPTLPDGTAGAPYGPVWFVPHFGNPPYTWTATGLPLNWKFEPGTGDNYVLSADAGDVTQGTFYFDVALQDTSGGSLTSTFNVTIHDGLVITTPNALPGGTSQLPYDTTVAASGGIQPYTWSITGQPAGWDIDPATGHISAAALDVAAGTHQFVVTVEDSAATPAQTMKSFTVDIVPNGSPLAMGTTTLPAAKEGHAYGHALNAIGGAPPYTWSASGLPSTMTLDPTTGLLQSTQLTDPPGVYSLDITVSDSVGIFVSSTIGLQVLAMDPLVISSQGLPPGPVGQPYSAPINAFGGAGGDYDWALVGGDLPPGITGLPGSGRPGATLSGTPTDPGTYNFTVEVTDTLGNQATGIFTIEITRVDVTSNGGGDDDSGCTVTGAGTLWAAILPLLLPALLRRRRRRQTAP